MILVAEGVPARVRNLLAQEKKKVARIVGDTPIYDIVVGDEEGQIPLRKLSAHVMKLPRNLTAGEVNALGRRMSAMGGSRCRCPAGRCPAASRCRSASARSAAAEPGSTPYPRRARDYVQSSMPHRRANGSRVAERASDGRPVQVAGLEVPAPGGVGR